MLKISKLLLLTLSIFMLNGCGSEENADAGEIEFTVLHENQYNEYANTTAKTVMVITNQNDYERELLTRSGEAIEQVDFEVSVILLIDMGPRNTGGYNVSLIAIKNLDSYLGVTIEYSIPGEGCSTTQAITNPYQFISVANTRDILVNETLHVKNCE